MPPTSMASPWPAVECASSATEPRCHPGGSVRDQEVVDAADEHGIAMACSGVRLFRH